MALAVLSGFYFVLATIASFGFGGYLAGRLRSRWSASTDTEEVEFRDGVHGLLVWGLAVALGALLSAAAATTIAGTSAPAASVPGTTAGKPLIAYELDRLFRTQQVPPSAADMSQSRAEAARIAMRVASRRHRDDAVQDRAHLVRIVSARTGLTGPDVETRVTEFGERATTAIRKARRSAVVVAFMTAAGVLLGAAVAWFAAVAGGSHRDATPLSVSWGLIRSPRSRQLGDNPLAPPSSGVYSQKSSWSAGRERRWPIVSSQVPEVIVHCVFKLSRRTSHVGA